MSYTTTKVKALKSYPTYQFYAKADSRTLDSSNVFKVCILETLRWIRARLEGHSELPQELSTPEPERYADFGDDMLISFSYNSGFQIDVIYIDTLGVWSFRIAEPDMGANIGTPNERHAVNGRTFSTEISFRKNETDVEIGIKTICSEPADNTKDCEVFRPRVVRALAENENLRIMHSGWILNGTPLLVKSKNDLEMFYDIFDDPGRSLPVIIIADTKTEVKKAVNVDVSPESFKPSMSSYSMSSPKKTSDGIKITLSEDLKPFKTNLIDEKKPKKAKQPAEKKVKPVYTKLPVFDYNRLAKTLVGLAIVVFVEDKHFKSIGNKIHTDIDYGDIIVIPRQQPTERYAYNDYRDNMDGFYESLHASSYELPKRSVFNYGDVLFYAEAKSKEYHDKRKQASTLEERCSLYKQENTELNAHIKELTQQQTDMQQTTEALRIAQKKAENLSSELESLKSEYDAYKAESEQKASAYRRSSELIDFYRSQIDNAARFPTDKNDICKWIQSNYSGQLIVAQRAVSELHKYSGSLDIAVLCDGVVYLDAYARYRRQEITEDILALYAERNNWEIQGCGKAALQMRRSDYTVSHNGKQYILDMHIKHGRQAEELIRIYFCWDEPERKVLLGSMPGHLATVRDGT